MIGVIFEVTPTDNGRQRYLDLAAALLPLLKQIDGFVSIERFQSLVDPSKVLSLSFWRDEKAVMAWRNIERHRMAQEEGRSDVFSDYRLRVVEVIRDYGLHDRTEAPKDSRVRHGASAESHG